MSANVRASVSGKMESSNSDHTSNTAQSLAEGLENISQDFEQSRKFKLLERCRVFYGLAGRRNNYRPLHEHRMHGRTIHKVVDPAMHLTWWDDQIFMKPLPYSMTPQDLDMRDPNIVPYADKVWGFLYTYTRLIVSELDLLLAIEERLIPELFWDEAVSIREKWTVWCSFLSKIDEMCRSLNPAEENSGSRSRQNADDGKKLASHQQRGLHYRYKYGDMRIRRLNLVLSASPDAMHFFEPLYYSRNKLSNLTQWAIVIFAFSTVVLTSMQVILAEPALPRPLTWFQLAARNFAYFTIVYTLAIVGGVASYYIVSQPLQWLVLLQKKKA